MKHGSKKILVIFASTLILTPFWVLLTYMEWQYIDFNLAISSFQKWPWIKAAIVMTITTYLYSYYAYYQFVNRSVAVEESAAVYGVAYIWIFFFIFYPGAHAFGGSDSNSWFWMTGILFTHYFAVKFFTQEIIKNANP